MSGFAKTIRLEHSKVVYKVIQVRSSGIQPSRILDFMQREFGDDETVAVRYDGEMRYVKRLDEFEMAEIRSNSILNNR